MKALPKRKGNKFGASVLMMFMNCLNESPSEKEGKWKEATGYSHSDDSLNESPSEKEGKL